MPLSVLAGRDLGDSRDSRLLLTVPRCTAALLGYGIEAPLDPQANDVVTEHLAAARPRTRQIQDLLHRAVKQLTGTATFDVEDVHAHCPARTRLTEPGAVARYCLGQEHFAEARPAVHLPQRPHPDP